MESKVCFAIKKDKNTGRMQDEIRLLKKILEFLFNEREKVLNTFKRNIFLMKVMDNNASEKKITNPFKSTNTKTSTRNKN